MKPIQWIAISIVLSLTVTTALADEETQEQATGGSTASTSEMMGSMQNATIDELRAEVVQLRAIVATLEATKPTFTSLMPEFAERFHVMHRAADSDDWAVAGHELQEMMRLMNVFRAIDEEKGILLNGFMNGPFLKVQKAIEHGQREAFYAGLQEATKSCNACHAATGSEFVQVTLDIGDSLSIRHPHKFDKSKAPVSHTH
ncbi:MAG: hypothetical protein OEU36_20510 [Gammaproteobacteria bacterium]|nr:hypothetical protein [Gammaproteobacteria bacterium]